jgi:hypothetical protein
MTRGGRCWGGAWRYAGWWATRSPAGVAIMCAALAGFGCTKKASVVLEDGSSYRGRIAGGTEDFLCVELRDGHAEVPRVEIRKVRHPGLGQKIAGAVITIGSAVIVASFATLLARHGDAMGVLRMGLIGYSVTLVGPGLGLLGYGIGVSRRSKARASEGLRQGGCGR